MRLALMMLCAALAMSVLIPTDLPAIGTGEAYEVPADLKDKWTAQAAFLRQEFDVCAEHCGQDAACLKKCGDAYEHKLSRAHGTLIFDKAVAEVGRGEADYKLHPSCPLCGMSREKFAHSRMLVQYDDGSVYAACSLHCVAIDLVVNIDKAPARIMVGDHATRQLIDAEKAVWVVGGSKPGVMSARAKWAFADDKAAREYMQENGGQMATFDEAIKASFEDMHEDTRMIRERRKAKRMKQAEAPRS
ncbi:nitrous oxide reductase accessory protein NosL [Desulfocurvibacter africanus]|uniref:nitrous oxide reductase accessory protein NosL n=1 Tax=Desulfocurvibacter africanus TaxID=873 RepID=UPI001B7F87C1|nr:nitrous oxide reductase accessory protein NosL [Desulfocurvibacter africanus]